MEQIQSILKEYWGYDNFRPMQEAAIARVLAGRDSIVVLPTGGGKSLCFQAPALAMPGLAVVISPLLALMKDQVDSLAGFGVAAGRIDSSQTPDERSQTLEQLRQGRLQLLYVSPERAVMPSFLDLLAKNPLAFFAVDESHCVSMWGHDFRPEYRALRVLRERFPDVALHAYTATATERVRHDIAEGLALRDPELVVGSFYRPNLVFRARRRQEARKQLREVIDRYPGQSGIVYCTTRKEVDRIAEALARDGLRALPYHAGLEDHQRKANQEAFIQDRAHIIVATVAFGMGIDKPDVRYVVHIGVPKSLEHYQQEAGRAGRDGLEAECLLLHGGNDFAFWRRMLGQIEDDQAREIALDKLDGIDQYCRGLRCRHRNLLEYFGENFDRDNCGGCDVCLCELETMDDALVTAQKILSCIVRLGERYGAAYVAKVLTGSEDETVLQRGHTSLSTYGILEDQTLRQVRDWIGQLLAQNYIERVGEYNILHLTQSGWHAVRGQAKPLLMETGKKQKREAATHEESWAGVDEELFQSLRKLRRRLAAEHDMQSYRIFPDRSLRDMARLRPTDPEAFLEVHGVGRKKAEQWGEIFLDAIARHASGEEPPVESSEAG